MSFCYDIQNSYANAKLLIYKANKLSHKFEIYVELKNYDVYDNIIFSYSGTINSLNHIDILRNAISQSYRIIAMIRRKAEKES